MVATVVVEDGTIVDGANSLVSVATFDAYLLQYGITLTGDHGVYLIKANDAMWSYNFNGYLKDPSQTTPFPRTSLYLNGELFPDDEIPYQAIKGQMELAISIAQGNDPLATNNNDAIKTATVGPLSVTFKDNVNANVSLLAVNSALKPLLESSGNGIRFSVKPAPWGCF